MSTTAKRLTGREVADALGVTRKTVASWTAKGILTAKAWKSPGGRMYWDYEVEQVDRLAEAMKGTE